MKFQIEKDTKLDGTTYYLVYTITSDDKSTFHKLFAEQKEAEDYLNMLMDNYRSGLPKVEIVTSLTIVQ